MCANFGGEWAQSHLSWPSVLINNKFIYFILFFKVPLPDHEQYMSSKDIERCLDGKSDELIQTDLQTANKIPLRHFGRHRIHEGY